MIKIHKIIKFMINNKYMMISMRLNKNIKKNQKKYKLINTIISNNKMR